MSDAERLTDEEREALWRVCLACDITLRPDQAAELVRLGSKAVPRLAARPGEREEREAALDAAWVDGYTTGADPAWCEKQLRRMGHRNEEPYTRRAAQRLLPDHAAHRAAPGGETRKEETDA